MMDDEAEDKEKSGKLFLHVYDLHHSLHYKDMVVKKDKSLVLISNKPIVSLSYRTVENLYSYCVNSYQLQWR